MTAMRKGSALLPAQAGIRHLDGAIISIPISYDIADMALTMDIAIVIDTILVGDRGMTNGLKLVWFGNPATPRDKFTKKATDRARRRKRGLSMTKGAIGTYTPILAKREGSSGITYWLVIWPISAKRDEDQGKMRLMDGFVLDGKGTDAYIFISIGTKIIEAATGMDETAPRHR